MKIFDLHCDTIVELAQRNEDLLENTTHFSLRYLKDLKPFVQTMAIFVPDNVQGPDALHYVAKYSTYLDQLAQKHSDLTEIVRSCDDIERITSAGKCALIRSLESGRALGGDLDSIERYADMGYKMMTLVWNGENELGSGHDTNHGLSAFGKEAIRRMEKAGLIVDCSHLNDPGFEQLCETAEKPFIASHSNSRKICGHKRNLTDEQFQEIVKREGLVGLNLCLPFIDEEEKGTKNMLFRHVYHMLELGGENVIACGSDFDGAKIHESLNSPLKFACLEEYFSQMGLSDEVIDKIFFQNAMEFFRKNVK